MSAVSNIYLIIFLPLLASISCQIFSKKFLPFLIALSSSISLGFFILKAFLDLSKYQNIANDFETSLLSIALEFNLDIVGATFLFLAIFLKTLTLLYYRSDIEESLGEGAKKNFYSVYLLSLFALVGIFTSNNLLNLFIFFEIYAFCFFAISSISQNKEIVRSSFKYFCTNAAVSLIILFCFLVIYLTVGELNFDKIAKNLQIIEEKWLLKGVFLFLMTSFLVKFFPFNLYLKTLQSKDSINNFLSADSLFIKTNIGVYVILKFTYFIFGDIQISENLNFTVIPAALIVIFYSLAKIWKQRDLKMIAVYFCFNNLGFILACLALKTTQSFQSLFFYILNFSLINLTLFLFASFSEKHFENSEIETIRLIKERYPALALPIKLLLFFLVAFPLSILFFANWYLAYAAFNFGFESVLLIALLASSFVQFNFAAKIISIFTLKESIAEQDEGGPELSIKKYQFYLLVFWFLLLASYSSIFALEMINGLSFNFASYITVI